MVTHMDMPGRSGFTLIELLVVLAIVALLGSLALPRYAASVDKAREAALQENLRTIRVSLDRFRADKGRWPKQLEELVEHKYVAKVPVDPITETAGTWIVQPPADSGEEGVADVHSGAPGNMRDGRPYAAL
jgi:general secretion pathway protein G